MSLYPLVARLMKAKGLFPWLPAKTIGYVNDLKVLYQCDVKSVYQSLHFSSYGKFQMTKEAESIKQLLTRL